MSLTPGPAPKGSETYDGVMPRHAACERCRYQFGGSKIRRGVIVCPECAHANRFVLTSPERPVVRRWWLPLYALIAALVVVLVAASGNAVAAIVLAAVFAALVFVMGALREAFAPGPGEGRG